MVESNGIEGKPQRPAIHWKAFEHLTHSGLNGEGVAAMLKRSKVTCRECYGFGHSLPSCATAKRIKCYKQYNKLAKSFFSQYQRFSMNRDATDVWPMHKAWQDFCSAASTKESLKNGLVNMDAVAINNFIQDMNRMVCNHCSGWGHKAIDTKPRKSSLSSNERS